MSSLPSDSNPAGGAPAALIHRRKAIAAAVLVGLAAMCALAGYELVRSSSNTLFRTAYGKQRLAWIMAVTPAGVALMLYAYGRLLTWLGPRRTLLATTLGSAAIIAACYAALRASWRPAAAVLFVVREAYIVLLIEQYWSFLNSTLGSDWARKLNGPVCGVASLGAIAGASLVALLATRTGTAALLLIGAASTIPAAVLAHLAYRRCGEPAPERPARRTGALALPLFRQHRVLVLLVAIITLTQALSTCLDLSFQSRLHDAFASPDQQTSWSGAFFAWLNACAAFMQFIVAPLALKLLPLPFVHLAIPLLNLAMCLWALLQPSLRSAAAAFLAFKSLDYSLFRAAKELLYIPLPFDARYRAKEVIDVFAYRFGKGATSTAIAILHAAGRGLSDAALMGVAAASAAIWGALAWPASRLPRAAITCVMAGAAPAPAPPSSCSSANPSAGDRR